MSAWGLRVCDSQNHANMPIRHALLSVPNRVELWSIGLAMSPQNLSLWWFTGTNGLSVLKIRWSGCSGLLLIAFNQITQTNLEQSITEGDRWELESDIADSHRFFGP